MSSQDSALPAKNIIDNQIIFFANTGMFSEEAILKCLYWYGDKFMTGVSLIDIDTYRICLNPLSNGSVKNEELDFYLQKLERDLIDFQLRVTITKETLNIRDLLVAKAFSNGNFEEAPPGNSSDPIGFIPIA